MKRIDDHIDYDWYLQTVTESSCHTILTYVSEERDAVRIANFLRGHGLQVKIFPARYYMFMKQIKIAIYKK